jgi:hypothetical protein
MDPIRSSLSPSIHPEVVAALLPEFGEASLCEINLDEEALRWHEQYPDQFTDGQTLSSIRQSASAFLIVSTRASVWCGLTAATSRTGLTYYKAAISKRPAVSFTSASTSMCGRALSWPRRARVQFCSWMMTAIVTVAGVRAFSSNWTATPWTTMCSSLPIYKGSK